MTTNKYFSPLQKILSHQAEVKDLHPLLTKPMPIAIVENGEFLIYDIDPGQTSYSFIKRAPTPMPVPVGVRAAFPLECHAGKAACVVTGDVFDSLEGYVTIFHEFIHCQQYETCENHLKENLQVARNAQERNDFMWELNHPFPYDAPLFIDVYSHFFQSLEQNSLERSIDCRRALRKSLVTVDFEYMVWQEWKEGFARFIENRVRYRFGLEENHNGKALPYSRVSFYEGGSKLIELLEKQDARITSDIEKLFFTMMAA
jgi:hypothetical protein